MGEGQGGGVGLHGQSSVPIRWHIQYIQWGGGGGGRGRRESRHFSLNTPAKVMLSTSVITGDNRGEHVQTENCPARPGGLKIFLERSGRLRRPGRLYGNWA